MNGELSMLSGMASLSDMHDLGSHRLHIYIERTLSTPLCFVLR